MSKSINFIPATMEKNLKPLNYPDCVFLNEYCKCNVLVVEECIGDTCSFYKNKSLKNLSDIRVKNRLNSLDDKEQIKISKVYYNEKMP